MENTIKILDEEIHYIYEENPNSLPIVLFVHGYNDNCKTIQPLKLLANRNYVIYALDLPGCGLSSCNKEISLVYYGQILNEFIKKVFKGKRINLMSHSMGSVPCLFNYKIDLIDKFIMIAPLNFSLVGTDIERYNRLLKWLLPNTLEDCYDSLINLVHNPSEAYLRNAKFIANRLFLKISETHKKFNNLIKDEILNSNFLQSKIKKLFVKSNPFYLISANKDQYVSPSQIDDVVKESKVIQSFQLNDCGHAVFYQKATEINNLINELIK